MATMGTAFITPNATDYAWNFYIGAEDNTAGTAYWTSDGSGYAHVDYATVDTTTGVDKNTWALVSQSTRIVNLFPAQEIQSINIRRGRTRPDQGDDVGECTIQVLNQTGSSDPDNNAGRYKRLTAGTANPTYASWLKPGVYGQIGWGIGGGAYWPVFTGVLESVEPTDDVLSVATYTFVDRLALLGRATMVNGSKMGATGDTGSQRIKAILQAARLYDIYNGNGGTNLIERVVDVQGFSRPVQLGAMGDTALDCLRTVANGEAGRVFVNSLGVINVWDRSKMATYASAAAGTFTDTPATVGGFGYDEIHSNQGQNFLYNSALINAGTTVSASYKNDLSIAQYGERRYEADACLLSQNDALAVAVFYGSNWSNPSKSVASLSLQAYGFSNADMQTLVQFELQQSVRVYRKLPGGRVLDVNCVIEGIEIDITPENRRFTFYLSPKDSTTISWPA